MAFPTDQTVSFTGQQNLAGDKRALFQTLFAGEVLTEFHVQNKFLNTHRVKTLTNGKEYAFPMVGTFNNSSYHTPGQLIQGSQLAHSKRKVSVDDLLIAPIFIDKLDESLLEYDSRSIYTKECGKDLAHIMDRNIARMACKAALITDSTLATAAGLNPVNGETFTPNPVFGAVGDELKGAKIYEKVLEARQNWDERGIDYSNATLFLRPAQYYALINDTSVQNMIWINKDVGGEGNTANGSIAKLAGINIVVTNHLPSTDETLGTSDPEPLAAHSNREAQYRGDYSKVMGLLTCPDAVATVKVHDLMTEGEYQINRQGWLYVAKYAVGHNILRPACAQVLLAA